MSAAPRLVSALARGHQDPAHGSTFDAGTSRLSSANLSDRHIPALTWNFTSHNEGGQPAATSLALGKCAETSL